MLFFNLKRDNFYEISDKTKEKGKRSQVKRNTRALLRLKEKNILSDPLKLNDPKTEEIYENDPFQNSTSFKNPSM